MGAVDTIVVTRTKGPAWQFKRTPEGHYECKKKYTYRIVFDPELTTGKLVWVGCLLGQAIVTAEKSIGAKEAVFSYGKYVFSG